MFRFMSRSAAITVVAFMLVLVAVPAAHARPLDAGSQVSAPSWLDAALSWLSQVVLGNQPAPQDQAPAHVTAADGTLPGSLMHPLTGSCIDPEGRPRPCF